MLIFKNDSPPSLTVIAVVVVVCIAIALVGAPELGLSLLAIFLGVSLLEFLFNR